MKSALLKKIGRYTWKVLAVLLGLILLLYIGIYWYATANKQKIIAQVTEQVSSRLNGKVHIGDVELSFLRSFPRVAVLMKNVTLEDSLYSIHHHRLLDAKELYLTLSIARLIQKQPALNGFRIRNGSIDIFTDSTGFSNLYLIRKKDSSQASSAPSANILEFIELENVRVGLTDRLRHKQHQLLAGKLKMKITEHGDRLDLATKLSVLSNGLGFNLNKGFFLKDKTIKGDVLLYYTPSTQQLSFNDIYLKLDGHGFRFTGAFDLTRNNPQFRLNIQAKQLDYKWVQEILPVKIAQSLAIVALDRPVDATANLTGPLKGGDPLLQVMFQTKGTHMATPFLDFDEATFQGFYTNEVVKGLPRTDPNSRIVVNGLQASWHGLPVQVSRIEILDLLNPTLTCDLSSSFPLAKLNDLIGSESIQLKDGDGQVQLTYKGPIVRNNNTNSFLNGSINLKNGTVFYAPRGIEMKQVAANIVFKNSDLYIDNMHTLVLNHNISMGGFAKNLLTLINTEPNKVNISWNIFAPSIDLSAFTYLLKKRKASASKGESKSINDIARKIDNMLDQGRLDVTLRTNRLGYKKFVAGNVLADISLLQDRYVINKVSMSHAGGSVSFNGSLLNSGSNHQAILNADMNNVDVKKLFMAFDNFGQDGITAESLEGIFSTHVNASMQLDENGKVYPPSVESQVDFSLKNGALNNYEPVKKLQKFVFKNRDFNNIRFAEIRDRLLIHDREITINKMEIQSSVMSLFVEGLYSRKGNTDISIQLPLSNLKKRDADYNPENIGVEAKKGSSIFLRGRPGSDGNIKFKLDLFNRYAKEKVVK